MEDCCLFHAFDMKASYHQSFFVAKKGTLRWCNFSGTESFSDPPLDVLFPQKCMLRLTLEYFAWLDFRVGDGKHFRGKSTSKGYRVPKPSIYVL